MMKMKRNINRSSVCARNKENNKRQYYTHTGDAGSGTKWKGSESEMEVPSSIASAAELTPCHGCKLSWKIYFRRIAKHSCINLQTSSSSIDGTSASKNISWMLRNMLTPKGLEAFSKTQMVL